MAKTQNVIKFKKGFHLNIGIVVFLIIIIYVVYNIIRYFTTETIAEYQVGYGTIATNNIYSGLIFRDETVCYSEQSGYINYYVKSGSRVAYQDVVYSIDTKGDIATQINSAITDSSKMSQESISTIVSELEIFQNTYSSNQFYNVRDKKNDINSELSQILSLQALSELTQQVQIAESNNTFYRIQAHDTGIITYYLDGYEGLTVDDFSPDLLDHTNYSKEYLDSASEVQKSQPVYKRINSEKWNIIIPISDELAQTLNNTSSVKIKFCKDGYVTTTESSIIKKENSYYLNLCLNTAMIRYINERFINIELILNNDTGLKIPQSAITSKEFFTVPKEYFTKGGDSSDEGLLVSRKNKNGESIVEFITPTIYYEKDENYYIDSESVSNGEVIIKNDSNDIYTIGEDIDSLIGVYNINKGYAVFKQIDIIYENEDYAIVEMKTAYGISLYDHIALHGDKIKENQLIKK